LITLYHKATRIEKAPCVHAECSLSSFHTDSIAFAELSAYIEDARNNCGELQPKLSELYAEQIKRYGGLKFTQPD
jgi:hypothetical protein